MRDGYGRMGEGATEGRWPPDGVVAVYQTRVDEALDATDVVGGGVVVPLVERK